MEEEDRAEEADMFDEEIESDVAEETLTRSELEGSKLDEEEGCEGRCASEGVWDGECTLP